MDLFEEVMMPYRLFTDSKGTEWQVWDIVPRHTERRSSETSDRRIEKKAIPFPERRIITRRQSNTGRRSLLTGSFAEGWLCFDSDSEKRRLSPIPLDWATCSLQLLERYAAQARTVKGIEAAS